MKLVRIMRSAVLAVLTFSCRDDLPLQPPLGNPF